MKNPTLRKLKIAKNLLEIALEVAPYPICNDNYQCTHCNPTCKAMNAIHSALYWVTDVAKTMDEEEKGKANPINTNATRMEDEDTRV